MALHLVNNVKQRTKEHNVGLWNHSSTITKHV